MVAYGFRESHAIYSRDLILYLLLGKRDAFKSGKTMEVGRRIPAFQCRDLHVLGKISSMGFGHAKWSNFHGSRMPISANQPEMSTKRLDAWKRQCSTVTVLT
jgi:hypothetical protein